MAGVLTYSPKDVKLVLSGYTLTGILSITVEWNSPQMSIRRGIRGQHTRVFNRDLSCKISVDVLQTSPTNEVLYEIFRIDRGTNLARLDMSISDNSSRAILSSSEAYITALPTVRYTEGFDARTWVFEMMAVTDGRLTGGLDEGEGLLSSIPGLDQLKGLVGL